MFIYKGTIAYNISINIGHVCVCVGGGGWGVR